MAMSGSFFAEQDLLTAIANIVVGVFVLMQMELSPRHAAVSARLEALVLMLLAIASIQITKGHGMVQAA